VKEGSKLVWRNHPEEGSFYRCEGWPRGCGQVKEGGDAIVAEGAGRCQGGVGDIEAVTMSVRAQQERDGGVVSVLAYPCTVADGVVHGDGDRACEGI
jgi:hypothetical protein